MSVNRMNVLQINGPGLCSHVHLNGPTPSSSHPLSDPSMAIPCIVRPFRFKYVATPSTCRTEWLSKKLSMYAQISGTPSQSYLSEPVQVSTTPLHFSKCSEKIRCDGGISDNCMVNLTSKSFHNLGFLKYRNQTGAKFTVIISVKFNKE